MISVIATEEKVVVPAFQSNYCNCNSNISIRNRNNKISERN